MNTGLDQYMDIFKDAVEDSTAKITKSFEKILIEVIILFMVIPRKIKVLKTKMKNLLGESLTHLDNEFEKFKRGILKVKDYMFTFLSNPSVPYDNNASERGVRKIKIKQKVSGCFRTDGGADDFAKLHSIAETAMKNGNSKFNAILAVVQQ